MQEVPIEEVAAQISAAQAGDSDASAVYFMISDILPEDHRLRRDLAQRKLTDMLALQQVTTLCVILLLWCCSEAGKTLL